MTLKSHFFDLFWGFTPASAGSREKRIFKEPDEKTIQVTNAGASVVALDSPGSSFFFELLLVGQTALSLVNSQLPSTPMKTPHYLGGSWSLMELNQLTLANHREIIVTTDAYIYIYTYLIYIYLIHTRTHKPT